MKNNTIWCCSCCPSGITHLTFGSAFNQSVDNLPHGIICLIFGTFSNFNQPLNNLPKFVEFIELPTRYDKKIYNIPKSLKIIKCSILYNYVNDFVGLKVNLSSLVVPT